MTTSLVYLQAAYGLGIGAFNFDTDIYNVALTTSSYTPNITTHTYLSDITDELPATGGYTTGGLTLTGVNWTADTVAMTIALGADPSVWNPATFTGARYAVVYQNTSVAATSRLLCYVDFGADQSPSGVAFTIDWSAGTVLSLPVNA